MKLQKTFVMIAVCLAGFSAYAGNTFPELLGAWTATAYIVGGQRVSVPDPKEHVISIFTETGINHFFSFRDDKPGYCGWRGLWSYDEATKVLTQRILAVDPKSRPDCANNPEIQPGIQLQRPLAIASDEMTISSEGADPVKTIWTRLEDTYPTPVPAP